MEGTEVITRTEHTMCMLHVMLYKRTLHKPKLSERLQTKEQSTPARGWGPQRLLFFWLKTQPRWSHLAATVAATFVKLLIPFAAR